MERTSTKLILALFVGLVACETISGEPPCATACISSAVSAVSCFPADLGCQCNGAPKIAFLAGPCLLASCSPDDLQSLSLAESAACSSFSAGKLTTLGNNNVATATRSSSTAQTPSPAAMGLGPPPPQVETASATEAASASAKTAASTASTTSAAPTTSGSQEEGTSAKLGTGGSAAIGLSGVFAGAGAVSIIMWTWQRKKRRAADAEARKKESIPVDDLAAWIRQNAKVEEQREEDVEEKGEKRDLKKLRYTGINMTGLNGPVELDVPSGVAELPGVIPRHEVE